MDTIILGNTAYTTLKQLQEMTTQFPAIETPFAQDLLREFEEFMLVEWLSDQNYHKYRRLEALHYARHNFDSAESIVLFVYQNSDKKSPPFSEMYFSRNHKGSKQKFAELKKTFLCDIIFKETFPKGERRFGI